jgi:aspartyl aminopeptidase
MPKVGSKHYSYTPKGIAMAKNAAKKKGVKVQYKNKGGKVVKCRGGGAATQGLEFKMKT